jgi:hypothetical protein
MDEEMITEKQAQRLVEWAVSHGHTTEEAYEALAFVMNAEADNEKEDSPTKK